MEIHKTKERKNDNESTGYKCFALLNWLDTKLELTNDVNDVIKRKDLYEYIISNFYKDLEFKNIDFMKQVVKLFFMHEIIYHYQDDKYHFCYVKYRR